MPFRFQDRWLWIILEHMEPSRHFSQSPPVLHDGIVGKICQGKDYDEKHLKPPWLYPALLSQNAETVFRVFDSFKLDKQHFLEEQPHKYVASDLLFPCGLEKSIFTDMIYKYSLHLCYFIMPNVKCDIHAVIAYKCVIVGWVIF